MEMLLIPILLVVMVVVINLANGNLGSVARGVVQTDDQQLSDNDEAGYAPMVNIGGTPMFGNVDCDGNPFGADDGLDYGFDDSGSVFDD